MYMGNKMRFINNADEKFSNCKSKIMLCNTVFRIGLYAKVDIKAGTELFFNYNYPVEFMQGFTQPNDKLTAVGQTVSSKVKNKSSTMSSGKPHIPISLAQNSEQLSANVILNSSRGVRAAKRATQSSWKNLHVSECIPRAEPDKDSETSGDGITQYKLSNQRKSAIGRSSVVAVRVQRKDEARPDTRTSKRKRHVIFTSDEE